MSRFLPTAASAHSDQIDLVVTLVHVLMAVLFIGWSIYFVWVLVRFRRARQPHAIVNGATGRPAFWVEVGVVTGEALLLVGLALPIWIERTAAQPDPESRPLVVRVIAEQFVWNVHYPGPDGAFGMTLPTLVSASNTIGLDRSSATGSDDVVVVNQLHVPVGRAVVVQLSSKDVIHSFGIPEMRVKQDVIPGSLTSTWFVPTIEGRFDVVCSQLCGLAHFRMRATVTVESEEAFAAFLAREAATR